MRKLIKSLKNFSVSFLIATASSRNYQTFKDMKDLHTLMFKDVCAQFYHAKEYFRRKGISRSISENILAKSHTLAKFAQGPSQALEIAKITSVDMQMKGKFLTHFEVVYPSTKLIFLCTILPLKKVKSINNDEVES